MNDVVDAGCEGCAERPSSLCMPVPEEDVPFIKVGGDVSTVSATGRATV